MPEAVDRHTRRKQRTHMLIKQAALDLLLERGYDAVSVGDIADRADLGRGTFYTHYKDKDEVVWEIVRESFKHYADGTAPDLPGCPCGLENAHCFWLRIFWRADQNRELYRLLLTSQGSAAITEWIQTYLSQLIADHYTLLFPKGSSVEQIYLTQFLTGALFRLLVWWLETPNVCDYETMARQFDQIVSSLSA